MQISRSFYWVFFTIITIGFFNNNIFAQTDSKTKFYGTIGYPGAMFTGSSSFAITGSIGIEHPMSNRMSFEAQISAAQHTFDRQEDIFTHDGGFIKYYTGSAGMRIYWVGSDKKHPLFTNLLLGGGRWLEEEYNALNELNIKNSTTVMLSSGTYIIFNKRVIAGFTIKGAEANSRGEVFFSVDIGYRF